MNTRGVVASIGIIALILFLVFVFYSKSQWQLLHAEKSEVIIEEQKDNESLKVGQVSLIFTKNETDFCNNFRDDDADELIDCQDSDCYLSEVCRNETI